MMRATFKMPSFDLPAPSAAVVQIDPVGGQKPRWRRLASRWRLSAIERPATRQKEEVTAVPPPAASFTSVVIKQAMRPWQLNALAALQAFNTILLIVVLWKGR